MAHNRSYRLKVKIGNWNEDLVREEDAMKEYFEKKENGDLLIQKVDFLKQNILEQVNLSVSSDGRLHFGDVVMLVNLGGENQPRSAVSINADVGSLTKTLSPGIQTPCGVCAGSGIQPCVRTAFIITSVDGSPEGSSLHFDQCFALRTTGGFARGLYLTSDLQSFQKRSKMSGFQEVYLDDSMCFLSWWKIVYFDPQERLEYEGQPVPANEKVLIVHCKTNQALAALGDQPLWTAYGKEYEVTAHTFLDSHKAEEQVNHWILCTSDPPGEGLVALRQEETAANH
ncbi:cilia- and flagella-associated protein 161 [Fundulus heteroclitus]|uniref:cilia- and flagella-associated protein 161 n=1 Tax=Fundulus heteroclitus TaxID=8078 RepID=UPI00165ACB0C|nr:cilia- and flagella-associated protein 161 [Fundulus heteroclitus]